MLRVAMAREQTALPYINLYSMGGMAMVKLLGLSVYLVITTLMLVASAGTIFVPVAALAVIAGAYALLVVILTELKRSFI